MTALNLSFIEKFKKIKISKISKGHAQKNGPK